MVSKIYRKVLGWPKVRSGFSVASYGTIPNFLANPIHVSFAQYFATDSFLPLSTPP